MFSNIDESAIASLVPRETPLIWLSMIFSLMLMRKWSRCWNTW